jgi:DNA/RNA endonuclease G (NUC1)
MKKYPAVVFILVLVTFAFSGPRHFTSAAGLEETRLDASAVSPNIVISQFQAGGGVADDEFVELHNIGSQAVDLNGYRLVYRSQNGTNDVGPFAVWTTPTVIQPGQYYLIASTNYDGGVTPDRTYNPATCMCSMSATNGGLAIRQGDQNTGVIIDAVGWGTGSNIFFEGTRTTAPPLNTSQFRALNGCQDTDNNANDFANLNPASARNSGTSPFVCSGGGTTLFAAMSANPTTVPPGGNTLLRVTVIPATNPPSTFIAVAANLQSIGGPSSQPFFDDGTNGDTTPGDNVFSFLATVAPGTPGGSAPIVGAAVDLQGRVAPVQVFLTINTPLPNEDPLILGNPSGATADIGNENNYLMPKPQYTLSYNRSNATPNWVAWRLDSSWIGSFNNGDFAPDTTLPAGWYRVLPEDYAEPVYDRGHMCPAGDRTNSQENNSATFLMTNIVPQHPDNNQGPWNDFENYCRSLASAGNEIYIFTGPSGNIGTIGSTPQNRITIPAVTWKVVLVLPNGSNDLARISKATRVFGIVITNQAQNRNTPWRSFRVTVDQVERLTGYDFFKAIPKNTQEMIERRRDNQ